MRILLGGNIIWPTSSHRRKFKIEGRNSKDLLYKIKTKMNNNDCGFEKLQNLSNPTLESSLSICLPSFPNPGPTPTLYPFCQDSFSNVLTYSLIIPYNIFDSIIPLLQLTYLPSQCYIFCLKGGGGRKSTKTHGVWFVLSAVGQLLLLLSMRPVLGVLISPLSLH